MRFWGGIVNGKQHLASGMALSVLGMVGVRAGSVSGMPWLQSAASAVSARASPDGIAAVAACALCYLAGCIAPDADQPNSMAGKHFHVKAEHRTWTQSIYPVALCLVSGWLASPQILWFGLGYLAHLVVDSFSKCGVCWFDCFGGYRKYESGAKIKKGFHVVLYTNDAFAWLWCVVLWVGALASCWFARGIILPRWFA